MFRNNTEKVISFFLFLSFFFCYAQDNSEIDRLLTKADENIWIDFTQTLEYSKEASLKAEATGNSEQKAMAYYYIVRCLVFYKDFKTANLYLEKGLQEEALKKNTFLKVLYLDVQSAYYSRMSLPNLTIKNYIEILNLLNSKKDFHSKILIAKTYIHIADYYTEIEDYESAQKYAGQAIDLIEKIPEEKYLSVKRILYCKADIYFYSSWIYLHEHNVDKGKLYVEKAYHQALYENHKYLASFMEVYGDYYYLNGEYQKSVDFYLKSIENKKDFKQLTFMGYIYSKTAKAYGKLGDNGKESQFLDLAEKSHEADLRTGNDLLEKELLKILKKEQENKDKILRDNWIKAGSIISFFIILLLILLMVYQCSKKLKKQEIDQHKIWIYEKEDNIKDHKEEIATLQQKVNESFAILIELAKKNSPQFWVRFQEVYPQFTTNLIERNVPLKVSELTLCAYIYLGFSSKEIADLTFKAYKTIENNRYNLRKKLQLPSNIDMAVWLRENINQDKY